MAIDYGRFHRLTARAQEIVDAPGASPVVVSVYRHATQAPLSRFTAAHAAVDDGITRLNRANLDLSRQLPAVTRHSNTALAVIKAVVPATKLPAPLKSQPTDTDKRAMLQRVLKLLDAHRGQDWADELLQGDFGAVAAASIQCLDDAIQAADALQAARQERAASFGPAQKAFVAYKRLIRSFFGPSSRQYRRLLVRTLDAGDEEAPAQPSPPPPPPREEPLPAGGAETAGATEAAEGVNEGGEAVLHGGERRPGEALESNLEHEDQRQLLLRRTARLRQLASEILGDIAEHLEVEKASPDRVATAPRIAASRLPDHPLPATVYQILSPPSP